MSTITCYNCAGLGFTFGIENLKWVYKICTECKVKGKGIVQKHIKDNVEESSMQNEIDWSKAPSDAEYYEDFTGIFYKVIGNQAFFYDEDDNLWKKSCCDVEDVITLEKRPEELLKEGGEMFTVGNEIEYSFNEDTWFKCKIEYVVQNNDTLSGVVAKCFLEECSEITQYLDVSDVLFREIDNNREKEIEHMKYVVQYYKGFDKQSDIESVCRILYNAGCRLVDEK